MKQNIISKYAVLLGILGTEAWFLWNPKDRKFEWEPIVCFISLLGTYIALDLKGRESNELHTRSSKSHPNDVDLFIKLQKLLPSDGPIQFIKDHDFGGAFYREKIEPFGVFNYEWDNPEHEFIDEELEKQRKELLSNSTEFMAAIGKNTSATSKGYQSVVPDHVRNSPIPDWVKRDIKEIHESADALVESHQKMVRMGRKKLILK